MQARIPQNRVKAALVRPMAAKVMVVRRDEMLVVSHVVAPEVDMPE